MSVNSPGVEFLRTVTKFRETEKEKFVVVCLRPLLSVAQGRFVVTAKKFIQKSIMHVQIWSFSRKTFSFL